EPARPRARQHPRRQVDAAGGAREARHSLEDQARAAADLEHVLAGAVAGDQLDLEVVEHPVVRQVALALVPAGEVVVVGAVVHGRSRYSFASSSFFLVSNSASFRMPADLSSPSCLSVARICSRLSGGRCACCALALPIVFAIWPAIAKPMPMPAPWSAPPPPSPPRFMPSAAPIIISACASCWYAAIPPGALPMPDTYAMRSTSLSRRSLSAG